MTNSKALRDLIKSEGRTLKYVAKYLGLTTYGLALKINNKNEFKTSEVDTLCKLLRIKSLELKDALFVRNSDLKSSKEAV